MLLDDYAVIGNKVIVKEKGTDGDYIYKIQKITLKSEANSKVTDTATTAEVDVDNLTDASGKKITKDDLDADAKSLLEQNFEFSLSADPGVIPADTTLSVSKLVSGKEYDAAKLAVQSVASHMAVFSIDLLDDSNVKIEPDSTVGMVTITTDVPKGFNTDRLAVYRLNDTGYVKLNSSVAGGKITFQTDHFSTYVIVEEKEAEVTPSTTAAENQKDNAAQETTTAAEKTTTAAAETTTATKETVPPTGDSRNAAGMMILFVVSAGVGAILLNTKKKLF
jgi:hypothetical protein